MVSNTQFTTITGDGTATSFDLPANFKRMLLTASVWRSTSALQPMMFISDTDEWLQRRALNRYSAWGEWTMMGGQIHIWPVLSATETGPLWYRGMASDPESTFEPMLDSILRRLGARAVVLGHTPIAGGQITTRFGGRVVLIDTGMLGGENYPKGTASALEVRDGALAAIYEDGRRMTITAPPVATR